MLRIHDRIYTYVLDIYSLLSSRLLFFCLYCKFSLSHIFVCFHVYVYICVLLSCIGGNKDYLLTCYQNPNVCFYLEFIAKKNAFLQTGSS